jgi:hypothetical protein|tara:strand:+ start:446 stop:712 length:267 start_codon:yes stop_codon:yes gene_type:complete
MKNNIELAKLDNNEFVYGTYEEVEAYAEEQDTCVDRYLGHVNPSTVYNKFKWIGKGLSDPFAVSVPYNYDKASPKSDYNTRGVDQNKW